MALLLPYRPTDNETAKRKGERMKAKVQIHIIPKPHPDAKRDAAVAIDLLAEALADRIILSARSEAAKRDESHEEVFNHECG